MREAIKECARKNPIGSQLEGTPIGQGVTVIAEAITQNNARIFEALTKAGIKL